MYPPEAPEFSTRDSLFTSKSLLRHQPKSAHSAIRNQDNKQQQLMWKYGNKNNQVQATTQDRQWDGRYNVQREDDLTEFIGRATEQYGNGKLKYVLIGGVEIGTKPNQGDYQVRHVHFALLFHNPITKSAIIKNFGIKEGNGYYLVPRNRDLPYSGWRSHHIKEFSKVDPTQTLLYEAGELPSDGPKKEPVKRSTEEKKRKLDEILPEMRDMIQRGEDEKAFQKFPRTYLQYGEKLKSMILQTTKQLQGDMSNPHIWLHGFPGTGKTSLFQLVYPNVYKKDLNNRFFDLYDPRVHTHVVLEDLDHANVDKLGIQFLKTICDEAGFPIDQKYKTPQLARTTVLVTSNFHIDEIVPEGKGVDATKMAMHRRFWQIRVDELQRILHVKLLPKYERDQLKQEGSMDVRRIYIDWDYIRNCPTGTPLRSTEQYQEMIRKAYYNN